MRLGRANLLFMVGMLPVLVANTFDVRAEENGKDSAKKPRSIWEQETLTGDWGGARTVLKDKHGIDVTLNYIGETLAVLQGGLRRAASYEGRLEFSIDTSLEKLIGWRGGITHVTVFQIHNGGRNAAENVGSIADPSNIDALPTTRLFTAWLQQNFMDDRISIRFGQLAGDDEFITTATATGLINGTFGWPGIFASNMTSGGPAYPLATPGARVQVKPSPEFALLAAVFSGDPAGPHCNDEPQVCNKYGTTFSFSGGALWMGEMQYSVNQGKQAMGLPGVYKLGGWYATADFADQHFGLDGSGRVVSLADPLVRGPLNRSGNWGVYGVVDQTVWRGGEGSINIFVRSSLSPADRNIISYYIDGGVGFKGLLPGRPDDVLTLGAAYAHISRDAAALDRDTLAFSGAPYPIRDQEAAFELSYQLQVAPWWIVQPDLQYIIHPGGNVPDPGRPNAPVKNAFVAGLRSAVKF
ncbi:MAG TPA: carbohydrate porin [Pseudolabrys sp.]|nr:carbohydrate porin [Pseudolabrys sp.]